MGADPIRGAPDPYARTTPSRHADRTTYGRAEARAILAEAIVGHVGFVGPDGGPVVLPVGIAPDGDRVLLHGSSGSRMLRTLAAGAPVCLTVTHLDGLVLARSAFESSMNYRSLVVLGSARALAGDEKWAALQSLTEHLTPGRWDALRPMTAKEVAATTVLALDLAEFSVKARTGGPDDADDADWPVWAGHVPIRLVGGTPTAEAGAQECPQPALPRGLRGDLR
ncbi:MAG: pyridoxamine 5'-phosphate oxidase family protein [Candidatus Nanopelagicales bacterium]